MSHDVFAFDFPAQFNSVDDLPPDFELKATRRRADLISQIRAVVPGVDFRDPSWGMVVGRDWSIEVNLGDEDLCECFVLHVRGGEGAMAAAEQILRATSFRAMHHETGRFYTAAAEGMDEFRAWKGYVREVGCSLQAAE